MFLIKYIPLLFLMFLSSTDLFSQTIMGAGILNAAIDGETVEIPLNISSHNEPNSIYCDVNGGTSETGMFHFIFENVESFKDIKPQTLDLSDPGSYGKINGRTSLLFHHIPIKAVNLQFPQMMGKN